MAKPPPDPLRASLVSLDHGSDDPVAKAAPEAHDAHLDLVGLDGVSLSDATDEIATDEIATDELVEELHDQAPVAVAAHAHAHARDPFAAPAVKGVQMELDHPRPVVAPPPVVAVDDFPPPHEGELAPEPVEFQPIPGKIAHGALRKNAPLRLGIGLAAGLLVGYIASTPYSRRVERHVNALRADANVDRYRPFEEARQNAARLDAEADDRASSGALGTGAIWLLVGGVAVLLWYRFT